jgi:hypothetical protein
MIKNKSSKKICYIAGKMGGVENFNYPNFYAAEPTVIKLGYKPVNPARNFDGDQTLPYEVYMHKSLRQLLDCQAIYMLDGWESSRGANIEHDIAMALGLEIIYQTYPIPLKVEKQESIMQEAERIVGGDRREAYGHPSIQFGRLAKLGSAIFEKEISSFQVALFLIQLKISRLMNKPTRDGFVDLIGYTQCAYLIDEMNRFEEESRLAPF